MKHGVLFSSLLVAFIAVAGGVFVLVNQDGPPETSSLVVEAGLVLPEEEPQEQVIESPSTSQATVVPVSQPVKSVAQAPPPSKVPVALPPPSPAKAGFDGQSPPEDRDGGPPPPLPPAVPTPQPAESPQPPPQPVEKININTANLEELDQITGVGPAIAQRIIDYRQNVSLFYYVEDLKNVDGIGEVNFEKMRDEITVGDVTPPPTGEPPPIPPPQAPEAQKININTASIEELDRITGVGPAIAKNIIDYRTEHGPFQSIEEIKNVNGIADAKFEGMKEEITI